MKHLLKRYFNDIRKHDILMNARHLRSIRYFPKTDKIN